MNRVLAILLMLVAGANAQTIVFFGAGDNIGNSRTNFNGNFSNMLPFVQSAYSGRVDFVGVTNEAAGTAYVVTNSGNRWLLFGTNTGTGSAGAPQGPWTNWIAGSTYGVSNAGTYNMADTNLVLITVNTNKLTIQGTASQPTNVAWNGNSLWNVGGGATNNFKARGITNSHEGFAIYSVDVGGTNGTRGVNDVVTNVVMCSASNLTYDTGTNYPWSGASDFTGFVNTNAGQPFIQFRLPQGYTLFTVRHYGNGVITVAQNEVCGIRVNNLLVGTNAFGIYTAGSSVFAHWNTFTYSDYMRNTIAGSGFAGTLLFYNPSESNRFNFICRQKDGSYTGSNFYMFDLKARYMGDWQ